MIDQSWSQTINQPIHISFTLSLWNKIRLIICWTIDFCVLLCHPFEKGGIYCYSTNFFFHTFCPAEFSEMPWHTFIKLHHNDNPHVQMCTLGLEFPRWPLLPWKRQKCEKPKNGPNYIKLSELITHRQKAWHPSWELSKWLPLSWKPSKREKNENKSLINS